MTFGTFLELVPGSIHDLLNFGKINRIELYLNMVYQSNTYNNPFGSRTVFRFQMQIYSKQKLERSLGPALILIVRRPFKHEAHGKTHGKTLWIGNLKLVPPNCKYYKAAYNSTACDNPFRLLIIYVYRAIVRRENTLNCCPRCVIPCETHYLRITPRTPDIGPSRSLERVPVLVSTFAEVPTSRGDTDYNIITAQVYDSNSHII